MKRFNLTMILPLIALALAGCAATRGTSPRGLEVPIEGAAMKFIADVESGGYRVVSSAELKKLLDDGREITIISTLPLADEMVSGLIPGSLHAALPLAEKDLTPEDREHLLMAAGNDKQRTVVLYCGFVACRRSHIGAKLLVEYGFKNVYRYPAGIVGWGEAGYPLGR